MHEEARLITTARSSSETGKVEKLLTFFGLAAPSVRAHELWEKTRRPPAHSKSLRLFSSAAGLVELLAAVEGDVDQARCWSEQVHSVFVHADGGIESTKKMLGIFTHEASPSLKENTQTHSSWTVSGEVDGFGGAMAGLKVSLSDRAWGASYVADLTQTEAVPLVSSESGEAVFFTLRWKGVPIYVCLTEKLVDLDAELDTPNFDIRDHFFAAAPILLYLRWAFPRTAWQAPEAGACLIIDDPVLWTRYGFVRFGELLHLMGRHNFTTNIAFIPWNWRRNNRKTVELFKQNPDRYSLSIHGGEHTAAEFGTSDVEVLRSKIETAGQRMAAHEQASGLRHDPIMVFPQGVFSEAAIAGLKQANFRAVINTEVKCNESAHRRVRIADVWETAVMLYADFPIYTRRYPRQGIANLAFDLLLGKPCFIVIHHDHCIGHCEKLVAFIDRLNALKCPLTWRSPDEVVKRSYRQREAGTDVTEIQMYGSEIILENRGTTARRFQIRKQESDSSSVKEVRVGSELVPTECADGLVRFEAQLPPGEIAAINLRFREGAPVGTNGYARSSGLKIRLRRYLSELRDFYAPRRNLAARLYPVEHARN